MRILFWSEGFWPHIGGVSIIASQYLSALQARGYDCLVVTSRHRQDVPVHEHHKGIPIHRFPFSQVLERRDLTSVRGLRDEILTLKRGFAPHVIHLNECGPSVFFHRLTTGACQVPTVMTAHSVLPQVNGDDGLLVRTLQDTDWLCAVSQALLDDVRALSPQIAPRSSLTHNGLAMPALQPLPLTDDAFAAPRLVCVGRVVHDKGFDVAIAAFATVIRRLPQARLIIAGDGDARADLERQAAELNVRDAVEFKHWVPPEHIPALLNTATLVIVPSRWREPFGLVAVEAAQMSRAVIASGVGGLPEIIVDGETGLLVAREDHDALADAILGLLAEPDRVRRMGRAARERAQALFTLERFVEQHEQVYRRLVTS